MIIVTGMHRSGTSLVAMTLEALGVSFGDHTEFYGSDRWNARGYFERRDVIDLNSRLLTDFPRTGSRGAALLGQTRYLLQPRVEDVVGRVPRYAKEIRDIADEIDQGALKDPRFCVTWSAWDRVVDIECCVVAIRHPHDVALSLWRRQRIPVAVGMRFWRYHIQALRDVTPNRVVVVDLDSLLDEPAGELTMLLEGIGLEVELDDALHTFASTCAPELTTRSKPEGRPPLDRRTEELWNWLVELRPIPVAGGPQ